MIDLEHLYAMMDSLVVPYLFADTNHTIQYINKPGLAWYAKFGGAALIGQSLLACHNEKSVATIEEILEAFKNGEDERIYEDSARRRSYMTAVRAKDGRLLGYYERFEPPAD